MDAAGGGGHPQQPWPEATASALAVLPQQAPSVAACAGVPQHGAPAEASSGRARVICDGLPQQPPVPAAEKASAGSEPWVWVSLMVLLQQERGWTFGAGRNGPGDRFRLVSNSMTIETTVARGFDICQPRSMSKPAAAVVPLNLGADVPCCPPMAQNRIPAEAAGVLASAFKALGDPIRLQLMSMIASAPGGEVCVCDLTPAFAISGPTISHHLKVLREAGLVDAERRASWVYYRARPALMRRLATLLAVGETPPALVHAGPRPGRHR
jgi:ArsR family transcriptional regulator